MTAITIELDDDRLKSLGLLAKEAGVRIEEYIRQAVDAYVELSEQGPLPPPLTEEEKREIEAAIADVQAGRVTPHAHVVAAARTRIRS